jgi:hypothetical protein
VDPICDGFLVEEQRSAPFSRESTHATQDAICEGEISRPPWPEGGELKEKGSPEEDPPRGPETEGLHEASPASRPDDGSPCAALTGPEERSESAESGGGMTVQLEVDTPARRQTRYACLELLNIAVACITEGEEPESNATLGDNQASSIRMLNEPSDPKHACTRGSARPEAASWGALGDSSCNLAKWLTSSCGLWPEKFQGLRSVSRKKTMPEALGTYVLEEIEKGLKENDLEKKMLPEFFESLAGVGGVESPAPEGSAAEGTSMASEYVVPSPTVMEPKRLQPTRARIRRVLDNYPKEVLRTVHNPMKMIYKKQGMFIEESVKTEEADKTDDQRQAMEKPAKVKAVTWMLQRATKAMSTIKAKLAKAVPRITPTRSKWRIWDPGRSKAVVLRGVIVRNKHVHGVVSTSYTERIRMCSPGRSSIHILVC